MFPETIIHKKFEIDLSFDMKKYTVEKVYLLFFKSLFLVLTKTLFWQED